MASFLRIGGQHFLIQEKQNFTDHLISANHLLNNWTQSITKNKWSSVVIIGIYRMV